MLDFLLFCIALCLCIFIGSLLLQIGMFLCAFVVIGIMWVFEKIGGMFK
jgi:hypothetical protein